MKKTIILLFMTIWLIGIVQAAEWDNVKSYDSKTNTITITNALGLGSDLEKATLINNTYVCGTDCYAEKDITLYSDGELVSDVRFFRIDNGLNELSNIRSYQLKYYAEVKDYNFIPRIIETLSNGTNIYVDYDKIEIGSHYEWAEFNEGQIFPIGTYKVRFEGQKRPDWSYDWQINLQGFWSSEWATWGNISAGSQAEVTLISPSDKNITPINTVTYNASANITGGSFLTNMSLWTNSTGTWHRNQTATFSAAAIQSHDQEQTNTAADTNERGIIIEVNQNITLTKVTAYAGTVASQIRVYYLNETNIANATLTSGNATFNINLVEGNAYIICTGNKSTSAWKTPAAFPYNRTYVNFTKVVHTCGGGYFNETNVVREILSITIDSGTTYETRAFSSVIPLGNTTWNVEGCDTDGACGWNNASSPLYNRTIQYSPAPNVNLNAPANNTNSTNTFMFFNASVINVGGGITNVSFFINNSVYSSNTTGYNGTYILNQSLSDGTYTWFVQANSSGGVGNISVIRTFTLSRFFTNNYFYNLTTAETAQETLYVNITTNGSIPSNGKLIWNGTVYNADTTNTVGNNYNLSATIQIPVVGENINRTFFFNFTLNSIERSTTSKSQNVTELVWTNINSSYNNDFLNISFQDEVTLITINASIPTATFTFYLGNGTINKTYTYSNATNNFNYTFAGYPTDRNIKVLPNLQYKQNPNYPQRIWQPTLRTYNSSVYNQVLYLLNSADGIFVTFQTVNLALQTITGVDVNATKVSDGTLVAVGVTDGAGVVTFFLNPDIQQQVCFSKTNYVTQCLTIFPTQSAYTITMGLSSSTTTDYTIGIIRTISPSASFLDQYSVNNFIYTLNSSFWTVQKFEFRLFYGNNTLIVSNSSTNNGGTISYLNFNVSNTTHVYMNYSYIVNNTALNYTRVWIVQSTTGRSYSIWNVFTDLTLYINSGDGFWGIDDFAKTFISVLFIIITIGVVSNKYGIANEASIMAILFAVVFFLDVSIGFIPRIQFGNIVAVEHFPTILTFIILMALVIREERR